MGDRVAVLRVGVLQQCDSPQVLYDSPCNLFVAGFMGSPAMNLFEASIGESADAVFLGSQRIALSLELLTLRPGLKAYPSRTVIVGIRPEDLSVSLEEFGSSEAPGLVGEVELVEALGSELLVHFATDAHKIAAEGVLDADAAGLTEGTLAVSGGSVARVKPRAGLIAGTRIRFVLDPARLHFFDPASGEAILI